MDPSLFIQREAAYSYQKNHRYWTGLMLVVRIVLLSAFACDFLNDPGQYMLAICVCAVLGLDHILGVSGVYKRQWVGILDASFVLIVSAATSYYTAMVRSRVVVISRQSLAIPHWEWPS